MSVIASLIAKRRAVLAAVVVLGGAGAAVSGAAQASSLTARTAEPVAKRAAAGHVRDLGLSYPDREWNAYCRRVVAGVYRCTVYTISGQCFGRLTVYGSAEPMDRLRRVGAHLGRVAAVGPTVG
ncbi:MAG: hypothetical protein M3P44_03660 [Actinomycetota bacterium]|nr:hypothetical protein [Actinomycetota bacterium]